MIIRVATNDGFVLLDVVHAKTEEDARAAAYKHVWGAEEEPTSETIEEYTQRLKITGVLDAGTGFLIPPAN